MKRPKSVHPERAARSAASPFDSARVARLVQGRLRAFDSGRFAALAQAERLGRLLLALLLFLPAAALAQEPTPTPTPEIDLHVGRESPKWTTFELGGGVVRPTGSIVESIYGEDLAEPAFHMRGSVLFASIFDVGLSGGFAQITGRQVADDGTQSEDVTRLTLAPFAATGLVRLDIFPNQPLVPYAGGGLAYLVWSERDALADEQVDGDKYGWTAVVGVQILLDLLEPSRADDLDGFYGINDTYLTLEISRTEYDRLGQGVEGLDLSHWSARAAILFEY